MFNGFKRQRGSWSARQATIAYTSSRDAYPSDVEVDCQSISSLGDIRVLNNPSTEAANDNDVGAISDVLVSGNEIGYDENEEITSSELAILSTANSSLSVQSLGQMPSDMYPVHSGNSQKIDEWCTKNELIDETIFNGNSIRRQDVGDNFTYPLLSGLSRDQILTVRRISEEFMPLLRRTRQNVQNNAKFPRRYRDIPSVFYVRPSRELHGCSQDSSALVNGSWLGWTMVPRFTESEIRPY